MTPWRPLIVVLSALAFLWPAAVNGGPFLFFDSLQYIRSPDGAAAKIFGPSAKSEWSRTRPNYAKVTRTAPQDLALASLPRSGRSIYYGAIANLGARTGGFWLTMILQGLCAAAAIDLFCRAIGWTRLRTFLLAVAVTAVLTPMAVYASFVMPDVFAAVLLLTAAALAAGADRLSRTDIGVAFLLLAYSAATHTSHLAILVVTVGCAGLLYGLQRWRGGSGKAPAILAGVSLAGLAAAVIAGGAFNLAVKKAFGYPPLAMPFLTAREVAPGHPGAEWLRSHCPGAGFTVCKFADRLPLETNDFLWSSDPRTAVFTPASGPDQVALGEESTRVFLAIAKDRPVATAAALLKDSWEQFANFSLEGMNVVDDQGPNIDPLLPDSFIGSWHASLAYRKLWPTQSLTLGLGLLMGLSFLAIVGLGAKALKAGRAEPTDARVLAAGFVTVIGILANAAVCGGLSGVFGRYEARILPPLILVGAVAAVLLARSARVARRG